MNKLIMCGILLSMNLVHAESIKSRVHSVEDGILRFENNEKYQLIGDIVTDKFRSPDDAEAALLYWKHKFKNCDSFTRKVSTYSLDQKLPVYELACPSQGISVTYSEGSTFISRINEYEKK